MELMRAIRLLIVSALVFGMAGGAMAVAAAESTMYLVPLSDPDFLSPSWQPQKITTSFADPDFLSPNWQAPKITDSFADPSFLNAGWKVSNVTPVADPSFGGASWSVPKVSPYSDGNFLYTNWSVQSPKLFRYSMIEDSRYANLHLDPFASDSELADQGWDVSPNLW